MVDSLQNIFHIINQIKVLRVSEHCHTVFVKFLKKNDDERRQIATPPPPSPYNYSAKTLDLKGSVR